MASTCPHTSGLASSLSHDTDAEHLERLVAHLDECDACMHHLALLNERQEIDSPLTSLTRFADTIDFEPVERLKSAPLVNRHQRIGHFRILRKLGEDGMGEVFECVDERLGRHVAVKWIKPAILTPKLLERLESEARIQARLSHPNVVSLLDFGIAEGFPYLVMEWIRGENLRTIVREGVLNQI